VRAPRSASSSTGSDAFRSTIRNAVESNATAPNSARQVVVTRAKVLEMPETAQQLDAHVVERLT
jgi:hypothetical protein